MSTSSVTATTVSGTTRITGLASGLDVDSIVEQLMTAEKAKKLNKLQQKEQLAEWRQDAYRDAVEDIQAFTSEYFDTSVDSETSLLNADNFNQYTVTSSSSAVTATSNSSASAASHTVSVSQLATYATLASSVSISGDVTGSTALDYSSLGGTSFVITADDTDYTVSFASSAFSSCSSDSDAITVIQDAIDDAVGDGKLTVGTTTSSGTTVLTITATTTTTTDSDGNTITTDSGVDSIAISAPSSGTSALTALGFGSDSTKSNRVSTSSELQNIFDDSVFNDDDQIVMKINGTSFTFDSETTLSEMMSEINSSDCGATMEYDELSGKLVLTATETGAGATLVVTEPTDSAAGTSSFLSVLSVSTAGKDAKVTIDNVSLTRSSNTITVDGVTYTLNATTDSGEDATVSLTLDTDGIYDLISNFVEDYNSLIATLNSTIDEDYDSDYPPLTDDQKDEMDDDEITNWETQAKTGILEDDSLLTSFLRDMRNTLVDSISGLSTSIFDIGIDTGTYDENGKLVITADDLKAAIQSDPTAIMNLFTKESTDYSGVSKLYTLDTTELTTRYNEEGIAWRFYDILAKYTSTNTFESGNTGLILEKAGIDGDSSETDNALTTQIEKYQDAISEEEDRLDDYEDKLYAKYSTMETYISKMNAQLSALQSYTSSSSS